MYVQEQHWQCCQVLWGEVQWPREHWLHDLQPVQWNELRSQEVPRQRQEVCSGRPQRAQPPADVHTHGWRQGLACRVFLKTKFVIRSIKWNIPGAVIESGWWPCTAREARGGQAPWSVLSSSTWGSSVTPTTPCSISASGGQTSTCQTSSRGWRLTLR